MQDIVDALKTLPQPVPTVPTGAETVAADLRRGHRALIRRRRNRIVGSGLTAVAALAAVTLGVTQLGSAGSQPPAAREANVAPHRAPRVQLVVYTGSQPAGFRVTTVPAGWQVISSNRNAFVVAPPGADTSVESPLSVSRFGPTADTPTVTFDGRIVVMLQGVSQLPSGTPTTKLSINGRDGQLGRTAGGSLWLTFPDAAGNKVLVQMPASLGLTNDQMVSFAHGITVTSDARSASG